MFIFAVQRIGLSNVKDNFRWCVWDNFKWYMGQFPLMHGKISFDAWENFHWCQRQFPLMCGKISNDVWDNFKCCKGQLPLMHGKVSTDVRDNFHWFIVQFLLMFVTIYGVIFHLSMKQFPWMYGNISNGPKEQFAIVCKLTLHA